MPANSPASTKKRAPRLGRGLSSLMAAPVPVEAAPPTPTPESPAPADNITNGKPAPPSDEAPTDTSMPPVPRETPTTSEPAALIATTSNGNPSSELQYLPLDAITPNARQPRTHFESNALQALAQSIKSEGLMQPIVVRPTTSPDAPSPYELVAGERRWRAAHIAELKTVPAIVRSLDDQQMAEWALIENLQREDLNPIERAVAFQHLIDEFNLSQQAVGERVGLGRATVSNLLRLLNLTEYCRSLVSDNLLSMGQARALLSLTDPQAQDALAKRIVKEGLSVRQVEAEVRRLVKGNTPAQRKTKAATHQLADLERQITEQLGTKVVIRHAA